MAQGASPVTCKIVALESFFCPIPEFEPLSGVFEVHVFEQTPRDSLDILHQRIHDATVIIITTIPLGSVTLSPKVTPNLRAIMIMASGTDCVDLEACRKRNIRVLNSVNANTASVAEHGMALYFAARRMIVELHQRTVRNQWLERGTLLETMKDERNRAPLSLKDEKIGVIGHGAVGVFLQCHSADRVTHSLPKVNGLHLSAQPSEWLSESRIASNLAIPHRGILNGRHLKTS